MLLHETARECNQIIYLICRPVVNQKRKKNAVETRGNMRVQQFLFLLLLSLLSLLLVVVIALLFAQNLKHFLTAGHLKARLVNGTQWTGRLEILYNGIWNTVCDDNFGDVDAQVACRMLGFGRFQATFITYAFVFPCLLLQPTIFFVYLLRKS